MTGSGKRQGLLVSEAGSRMQSRLSVHVPVIITSADGTRRGILQDLSLRGARVTGSAGLGPHQRVVLQWHRFHAAGQVCWIEQETWGVHFARALSVRDLLETRELASDQLVDRDRELVRRTADAFVRGRVAL